MNENTADLTIQRQNECLQNKLVSLAQIKVTKNVQIDHLLQNKWLEYMNYKVF